ncbi:unnamed protein product [Discula destructiva]
MNPRKRPRKVQQQRLTFEPVGTGASSSSPPPGLGLSPARVRFSSPRAVQEGSPSRKLTATSSPLSMPGRKRKPKQQTFESSLGQRKVQTTPKKLEPEGDDEDSDDLPLVPSSTSRSTIKERPRAAPSPPRSSISRSSMFGSHTASRRMFVIDSDSETPVEEDGGVTDSDGEGPLRHETPQVARQGRAPPPPQITISSDEEDASLSEEDSENEVQGNMRSSQSLPNLAAADDDEDELPTRTPRSSMPRRGQKIIDEDEDDEDEQIQTPAKRRKITRQKAAPASSESAESDSEDLFSTPRVKRKGKGKGKGKTALVHLDSSPPASAARTMRSGARKHRSAREKKMELLRRHRAGEKDLTIEDLATSAEEGEGGLYDTGSEHEVLEVFEDEDSQSPATERATKKAEKKARKKALKTASNGRKDRDTSPPDEDANSEDEDFIDDDDDRLGVPDEALHLMPLEFTRSAIKPLRLHFKDAVAWLIHRRINPSFDKDNEVYVRAWRKLSDEVTGLANSKFISTVWRPDFHKALKARPYIEQQELGIGSIATELENCQACGRSGHPATWSIRPFGKPYDPRTLDEVDSDSDDEDEDSDNDEKVDRDIDGNTIPPETKHFYIGQTCNSNAETAHSLMHWKVGLRDWVDGTLEGEGLFEADQVLEREQMKPKKRKKVAEEIVERWDERGVVKGLFTDFQNNIESARNKDPTKVARGRRY